jgi:hypothetical protein
MTSGQLLSYKFRNFYGFRSFITVCPNVSPTCKILGFHGGDYEEWCLLGYYAVWLL